MDTMIIGELKELRSYCERFHDQRNELRLILQRKGGDGTRQLELLTDDCIRLEHLSGLLKLLIDYTERI